MPDTPQISIAIIVSSQRLRAARCLQSVLSQGGIERAEVLLFDLGAQRFPRLAGSDHPCVQLIPVDEPAGFRTLRMDALRRARGQAVAYVEDHTIVSPGWLDALVADFEASYAGVGAVPVFTHGTRGITDLLELMNYSQFEKVLARQEAGILPGHNSAYRRDCLLSLGEALPDLLSAELFLNREMHSRGDKLLIDPAAGFVHLDIASAADLFRICYLRDREFGCVRAKVDRWGAGRRFLQVISIPALPFVRLVRLVRDLLYQDRSKLKVLMRYLPVFLISQYCAAAGLGLGSVLGEGDADRRYTVFELNDLRFSPLVVSVERDQEA